MIVAKGYSPRRASIPSASKAASAELCKTVFSQAEVLKNQESSLVTKLSVREMAALLVMGKADT